jgi:hypothetical protein
MYLREILFDTPRIIPGCDSILVCVGLRLDNGIEPSLPSGNPRLPFFFFTFALSLLRCLGGLF